jgi:hypothetical protein
MIKKRYISKKEIAIEENSNLNLELEPKVKNNLRLQEEIDRIEKQIFEDIKKMIDDFESDESRKTKLKIISALKSKR